MKTLRFALLLLAMACLSLLAPRGRAQSTADSNTSSSSSEDSPSATTKQPLLDLSYKRPTEKSKLRNYLFDTVGGYTIAGTGLITSGNQYERTPPEWGQGVGAYSHRFGSNLGIAAVTTTTRYGLAEAFREDTTYYRCESKGFFRRFRHAMISTVTARSGEDGHIRLSFPALVAPYAGTMTAVYAWYPGRFGAKDGLRMGNYNLLAFAGENLLFEFIYGGPRTLFGHFHRSAYSGSDAPINSNR